MRYQEVLIKVMSGQVKAPIGSLRGCKSGNINRWCVAEHKKGPVEPVSSVADPGSGMGCLFDPLIPDSGWVKSQDPDPGPGWTTRILFPRAKNPFFGLKFLNSLMQIRDPGWKQFGSGILDEKSRIREPGSGINIPDPQYCLWECEKRQWGFESQA